ncbi:MAG: alpha/beta hydrolase family esterase [Panacagrimonas sp.]
MHCKNPVQQLAASLIFLSTMVFAGLPTRLAAQPSVVDATSGFLVPAPKLKYSSTSFKGRSIRTAEGLKAVEGTLKVAGATRRYVVLRRNTLRTSPGAPVMLLLHPRNTTPEAMANLSNVVDYVAAQGFWAVMPQALNGSWQDVPSDGNQDVQFIVKLIDRLVAQGADRNRIYAAGYSSGGFFASRLACELPDRIAAFGIVAASAQPELVRSCTPSVQRPRILIGGTDDSVSPYYGSDGTLGFFQKSSVDQACSGMVSTLLPNRARDGTTVQLDENTGCMGEVLRLYTVNRGGHAWPGGGAGSAGVTSRDINATGLIWDMARDFSLN